MRRVLLLLLLLTVVLPMSVSAQIVAVTQAQPPATVVNWTSGTSNDTAATVTVNALGRVIVTLHSTSTMTAGTLNFEATNPAATTYFPLKGRRLAGASLTGATESTFALAVTDQVWEFEVGGFSQFRVRLNPQISGSGTATINVAAQAGGGLTEIGVVQSTAANLNATVSGTVTANAGTNLNTSALMTSTNFTTVFGSASLVLATQQDDLANTTDGFTTTAMTYVYDGTTWDRLPGTSALGVLSNTELPAASALTDAMANPTTPLVGAALMCWNSATWDRCIPSQDATAGAAALTKGPQMMASDGTNATQVLVTTTQADNLANTLDGLNTTTFTYIFDGSTWDRWTGAITGTVTANAGTNLNTSALLTTTNFTTVFGTSTLLTLTQADALANTTDGLQTTTLNYWFNGTTWDRALGNATDGALVNLGTNNDVTVTSGSITVTQGTAANLLMQPFGNVASGATDSGNPIKIGGRYNSTPITLTDTQRGDLQLDPNGYVKVNVAAGGASGGTSSSFGAAFPATGTAFGLSDGTNMIAALATTTQADNLANTLDGLNTTTFLYVFDGSTWDRLKGDSTDGALVNLGVNNDVTVTSGTITANLGTIAGVATAAKQPALGTAGSASTDVITVQGIAAMTPLLATLSGTNNIATVTAVTAITNALPAGTNVLGHVIIDSGSTTVVTGNVTAVGAAASGATKSGNPLLMGGVFNTTQPTVTNGQAVDLQATARGAQIVATGVDAFTVAGSVTVTQSTAANLNATVDSELPAAAAAADGATNPTAPFVVAANSTFNGTTWDRWKGAANALNSTGTGLGTAQMIGQFDDTSPTAITENQFGNVRMSANRNQYMTLRDAAGNERGANVSAGNALLVDASATTQPISYATTGSGTATGAVRVELANNGTGLVGLNTGTNVVGFTVSAATATTTNAKTGCYVVSAASTNSTNCKASAGNFYGVRIINTTTTTYYLRLYNASGAPTCSSATGFIESIPIPPAGAAGQAGGIVALDDVGIGYTTGVAYCLTGGSSSTDNTNAATGIFGAIYYK